MLDWFQAEGSANLLGSLGAVVTAIFVFIFYVTGNRKFAFWTASGFVVLVAALYIAQPATKGPGAAAVSSPPVVSETVGCSSDLIRQCRSDTQMGLSAATISCVAAASCEPDNPEPLTLLGDHLQNRRDFEGASNAFEAARLLGERTRDAVVIARANFDLAQLYHTENLFDLAEKYARDSLSANIKLKDVGGQTANYQLLGEIKLSKNDFASSTLYFTKSMSLAETIDMKSFYWAAKMGLASIKVRSGSHSEGCRLLTEAHAALLELNDQLGVEVAEARMFEARCNS